MLLAIVRDVKLPAWFEQLKCTIQYQLFFFEGRLMQHQTGDDLCHRSNLPHKISGQKTRSPDNLNFAGASFALRTLQHSGIRVHTYDRRARRLLLDENR